MSCITSVDGIILWLLIGQLSCDVIGITLTLKMTTAQVVDRNVETSVTVNNKSPIHDYVKLDNQTQPTFEFYS